MRPQERKDFIANVRTLHQFKDDFRAALETFSASGKVEDCARAFALLAEYMRQADHCHELMIYDLEPRVNRIEGWIARGPKPPVVSAARRSSVGGSGRSRRKASGK